MTPVERKTFKIESVRELIGIPPRVERVLRYYMRTHPEDAAGIEKALTFRKSVREKFDRLVSKSRSPASAKISDERDSSAAGV